LQAPPAPEGGPCTNFELSTGHPAKDAHPERAARAEGSLQPLSPNSNHSRTSARVARKSNYSRTYAKTGGWGCLPRYRPGGWLTERTGRIPDTVN
jgi:hypothetical protein